MEKIFSSKIDGVVIKPLGQIVDERGAVLHMLRRDSNLYTRFGEIYFSVVNPGSIKAWRQHKLMTQHFAVPHGKIRLVLFDDRPSSPSRGTMEEHVLGRPDNYCLFRIPPMLWYGFMGISNEQSIIANFSDMPHDPKEVERAGVDDPRFSYDWAGQMTGK